MNGWLRLLFALGLAAATPSLAQDGPKGIAFVQAPEQGGAFEYRTDLRSADEPNYDGVARLLRGEDPDQRSLTLAPGTLNVFRGRNTPHRVTPVEGDRARLIAVFSYFEQPGVRFTEAEQRGFYGRTA